MAQSLAVTALGRIMPELRFPIFCGSMANAGGGKLVAAVRNGGGFGFLGSGSWTIDRLKEEIGVCEQELQGVTPLDARRPFGIGFFGFKLTAKHGGPYDPLTPSHDSPATAFVDAALSARPRAVWLSFGSNEELLSWAECLRLRDRVINGGAVDPVRLFVMVGTTEGIRFALDRIKPDVIVVQGGSGLRILQSLLMFCLPGRHRGRRSRVCCIASAGRSSLPGLLCCG